LEGKQNQQKLGDKKAIFHGGEKGKGGLLLGRQPKMGWYALFPYTLGGWKLKKGENTGFFQGRLPQIKMRNSKKGGRCEGLFSLVFIPRGGGEAQHGTPSPGHLLRVLRISKAPKPLLPKKNRNKKRRALSMIHRKKVAVNLGSLVPGEASSS